MTQPASTLGNLSLLYDKCMYHMLLSKVSGQFLFRLTGTKIYGFSLLQCGYGKSTFVYLTN